jgi:NADH dehydrogenase
MARIVVVGGGFGGTHVVWNLERLCRHMKDVEVVLVSSNNYFLMTPFLFEACSGMLQPTHCSAPIRDYLRRSRFIEATVQHVDLERRVVQALGGRRSHYELPYDTLVLAPGSVPNLALIKGSEHAFTFKTLADAFVLRNHLIEVFERCDVETDSAYKRKLLTLVVIGGGLVGVELLGELTAFVDGILPFYPHVRREQLRFVLLHAGSHILPEIVPQHASYAERVLLGRRGVDIRTGSRVQAIEPEAVHLADETIEAATIVFAGGTLPNPILESLPVEKTRHGEIVVDATMRCPSHSEVWALGDCASIPCPEGGTPYPKLAQHTLREAKALAGNVYAALQGKPARPFVYHTKGTMGALGHKRAFAVVLGIGFRGVLAWWLRRTYYLLQMPRWSRRLHIVLDWTAALLFRPDIVKLDAPGGSVADAGRRLAPSR